MDPGLTGKVAVVTGASKGIGLAVASALLDEGAKVVAGSRSGSPELDALAESGNLKSVLVDLRDALGPQRLVDESTEFGRLDILVNNVGATVSPGPVATDLWLGRDGVAATAARAMGVDFETAKARVIESQGGFSTGRFTRPEEVADVVLLLASQRAGNMTGSDVLIDGGLIKTL